MRTISSPSRGTTPRAPARRHGVLRLLADSQAGFSIVEVVISAVLVALIAGATATALITTGNLSADQRHHSQANQIAQQDQERLRGLSAKALLSMAPPGDSSCPTPTATCHRVTLDGTLYTVTSTGKFLAAASGNDSCLTSSDTGADYIKIKSSVNWQGNRRGAVTEQSIVTPVVGGAGGVAGTMLVQVANERGAALSGVGVSASGVDSESGTTDSSGCATFGGLTTGDYTVTLTKSGYIDDKGVLSPVTLPQPVNVSGSGTSTVPVKLAPAGALAATFSANNGALTNQQAPALSWFGSGQSYGMSAFQALTPSPSPATRIPATGTIALFPFLAAAPSTYTNNYSVWAGKCEQMKPPPGIDQFTVGPSSNQTVTVKEPALRVLVNYNGSPAKPNDIKLTFTSSTGPSCIDTRTPAVAGCQTGTTVQGCSTGTGVPTNGWLVSPGQPFATTATSGTTASASGYTGTYSVCADFLPSGSSTYRKATVTGVTNTNFTSATTVTVNIPTTFSTQC